MSRDRTAALAGVLYVGLDIVVGVMAGSPPAPAAPEGEIVAYLADHHSGLAAGLSASRLTSTAVAAAGAGQSAPAAPTFNTQVAPILNANCVICHRPDGIASRCMDG